ncbi:MAG: TGS domain-containing protein [Candidatus Hydrogenedentes bacterium]|nr:TGS domain-containing protein [Candidatus Hydrogenedentota bacterium]
MPTNLPPEYFEAEERFRAAATDQERIVCLEEMLAAIPKHKGTDRLRGDYRRKLSHLREAVQAHKKVSRHESAFHIEREGPARVVIVGAPNVGKSALLGAVTHATPRVSEYPFTTVLPLPGMMPLRDIHVQLVDTPPLSKAHVEHELFNLIHTADLIALTVDIQSEPLGQFEEVSGLLTSHHVELRARKQTLSDMGTGSIIPALVLVNKVDDDIWYEEYVAFRDLLGDRLPVMAISVTTGHNLDAMKEAVFEGLGIMRVYSKQPGKPAELHAPFVLKKGDTVAHFAAKVHKDFVHHLKTARIWGTGVHDGQMVGRDHVLHDGDVVELHG